MNECNGDFKKLHLDQTLWIMFHTALLYKVINNCFEKNISQYLMCISILIYFAMSIKINYLIPFFFFACVCIIHNEPDNCL